MLTCRDGLSQQENDHSHQRNKMEERAMPYAIAMLLPPHPATRMGAPARQALSVQVGSVCNGMSAALAQLAVSKGRIAL